jgi:septal ring factor EnvC (AmiA/AmiB activator)
MPTELEKERERAAQLARKAKDIRQLLASLAENAARPRSRAVNKQPARPPRPKQPA